jgi:uncharacterized repeat protein (TIGR02543 family)
VYAKWTAVSVQEITVTFDLDGGTFNGSITNPTRTVKSGAKIIDIPTPDNRNGFTFGGWYTQKDGGGTQFSSNTTVTASITTVYAKWTAVSVQDITVTFDLDGGKYNGSTTNPTRTVKSGAKITDIPTPDNRNGFTFGGWYTQKDGGGTQFSDNTTVTASITTVYAKWTAVSAPQQVTYDANGGTGTVPAPQPAGANVTLASGDGLTRVGRIFTGWNTEPNGTGDSYYAGKSYTTFTTDTKLYAEWTVGGAMYELTKNNYADNYVYTTSSSDFLLPSDFSVNTGEQVTISFEIKTDTDMKNFYGGIANNGPTWVWIVESSKRTVDADGQFYSVNWTLTAGASASVSEDPLVFQFGMDIVSETKVTIYVKNVHVANEGVKYELTKNYDSSSNIYSFESSDFLPSDFSVNTGDQITISFSVKTDTDMKNVYVGIGDWNNSGDWIVPGWNYKKTEVSADGKFHSVSWVLTATAAGPNGSLPLKFQFAIDEISNKNKVTIYVKDKSITKIPAPIGEVFFSWNAATDTDMVTLESGQSRMIYNNIPAVAVSRVVTAVTEGTKGYSIADGRFVIGSDEPTETKADDTTTEGKLDLSSPFRITIGYASMQNTNFQVYLNNNTSSQNNSALGSASRILNNMNQTANNITITGGTIIIDVYPSTFPQNVETLEKGFVSLRADSTTTALITSITLERITDTSTHVQVSLKPTADDPQLSNSSFFVNEEFTASAGSGYSSYTWYWNGDIISGATSSTYTLAANAKSPGIYELSIVVTTSGGERLSARRRVVIKAVY